MIPDSVKIGHLTVPIEKRKNPKSPEGDEILGRFCGHPAKIIIDKDLKEDELRATFLHEIIEAINSIFCLNISHNVIETLCVVLAQALEGFEYQKAVIRMGLGFSMTGEMEKDKGGNAEYESV